MNALLVALLLAVNPGEVSRSAEAVCGFRALGAQHPDPKLRNPDHLASRFCKTALNPQQPMVYFYVHARTQYIDAALARAARDGIAQVVVLGAGFDSRAYRFRESHPGLRFFEVDLPETIEAKKKRVAEVFGAVPDYVRYAPIDFNTQRLEEVLPALGYDPAQRTFFILEGVVMYVVEPGISATFGFIRKNSASGSRVVYDYVLRQVIDRKFDKHPAAAETAYWMERWGEPYVSGWTPRQAAAFAKKHGLQVVEDVGEKELTRRHLIGSDGRPAGATVNWTRLIEVKVP
jgi:methyltransferase (TIGR00027 family)